MAIEREDQLERLTVALEKLLPEDQYLLKARYGLPPNTRVILLEELAEVEGLSKERIRQKQTRAMDRLRAVFQDI